MTAISTKPKTKKVAICNAVHTFFNDTNLNDFYTEYEFMRELVDGFEACPAMNVRFFDVRVRNVANCILSIERNGQWGMWESMEQYERNMEQRERGF